MNTVHYDCSACHSKGKVVFMSRVPDFCPHCGERHTGDGRRTKFNKKELIIIYNLTGEAIHPKVQALRKMVHAELSWMGAFL